MAEGYKPDSAFIVLLDVNFNAPETSPNPCFFKCLKCSVLGIPLNDTLDEKLYRTCGLKTSF